MKTLRWLSLLVAVFPTFIAASNYYVSASAIGTKDGSFTHPFPAIQEAADRTNPGDTVFVRSGTYTNGSSFAALNIQRSGNPTQWIVYMAYPGEHPKIAFNDWIGIDINGASYIEVNGFEVQGCADSLDSATAWSMKDSLETGFNNGDGIATQSQSHAHHVRIVNNTVYNCCGGGIGINQSDYVTIENNITHHNAFWSPYECSGISVYQAWSSDTVTGYKIIIRRNVSFSNYNYIPGTEGEITDGNGIIIDDFRCTQNNSTQGVYKGRTLVENNISFNNGGRGLCLFSSGHVDAVNNTLYHNNLHPLIKDGELTLTRLYDARFFNNITVAVAPSPAIGADTSQSVQCDYNLVYGGVSKKPGTHDIKNLDPLFTATGVPAQTSDFQLRSGSPAIDAGTSIMQTTDDFTGVARPQGNAYDIGAYEYAPVMRIIDPAGKSQFGKGRVTKSQEYVLTVYDVQGRVAYHASVSPSVWKTRREGRAITDYLVQGSVASGTYFAVIREPSCHADVIPTRTKFIIGK